jgi:hypothetical protein
MMIFFFQILACISCFEVVSSNHAHVETWEVLNYSTIEVVGQTNINNFTCRIPSYEREKDVLYCEKRSDGKVTVKSTLTIPVTNFDCYHRIMTRDLQKTLKAETFPNLFIYIKHFSELPSLHQRFKTISSTTDIQLAGVNRTFKIDFVTSPAQNGYLEIKGETNMHFTDFNLIPPSKLGGTIKVKNELKVKVRLLLKKVQLS